MKKYICFTILISLLVPSIALGVSSDKIYNELKKIKSEVTKIKKKIDNVESKINKLINDKLDDGHILMICHPDLLSSFPMDYPCLDQEKDDITTIRNYLEGRQK